MGGLSSATGAQSPDHSTPVLSAISATGLTWQITATTTAAPLATVWAASTAYSVGDVVRHQRRLYRCEASGTSGTSGPVALGAGVVDGSAEWKGVVLPTNGLKIANIAASGGSSVFWDFGDAVATTGDAILAGGAFVTLSVADPTLLYIVTASSTARVCVAALC